MGMSSNGTDPPVIYRLGIHPADASIEKEEGDPPHARSLRSAYFARCRARSVRAVVTRFGLLCADRGATTFERVMTGLCPADVLEEVASGPGSWCPAKCNVSGSYTWSHVECVRSDLCMFSALKTNPCRFLTTAQALTVPILCTPPHRTRAM